MSESGDLPTRRRWVLPTALVVAGGCVLGVLGVLGVLAVALTRSGPDRSAGGPGTSSTSSAGSSGSAGPSAGPSAAPDQARPPVARGPLCGALRLADVRAALAAPVLRRNGYGPGQRVLLAPGVRDVSHEYACVYRARSGAQARVWVFAEPVTRRAATVLVRRAGSAKGCRPAPVATGFGDPSVGTLCPGPRRPGRDLVARGLFGDAYLSCELVTTGTETESEAVRRANSWCVGVAASLTEQP